VNDKKKLALVLILKVETLLGFEFIGSESSSTGFYRVTSMQTYL
jgi:hypothetical protein